MIVQEILLVVVGLVVLLGAGDLLVRGAVGLAKQLNIPSLLIGLTIVAFGTSAPELVVSVQAVMAGDNGIAIGNIVGSNIANVLLVFGVPALAASISLGSPGLRRHAVVMMLATLLFAYVVYEYGALDRLMGACFLGLITLYVGYIGSSAMFGTAETDLLDEVAEIDVAGPKTLLFLVAGLIGLPLGGWLLVTHGSALASTLGVREELIGLTVVAFGTSLPELATVWAAAMKRQADVAVGNIVGSNIFNILFVGGAVGMTGVTSFAEADATKLYDVPVMIGAAVVLSVMIFLRGTIGRVLGAIFAVAYLAYILFVSTHATGAVAL